MRPIRQYAHAATIFAIFWTLVVTGSIAGVVDSWRHGNLDVIGVVIVVSVIGIYAGILILTFYLWRTEKPKLANNVEGFIIDDLLDTKSLEIDLEHERKRLKRIIYSDAAMLIFPLFAAWVNKEYHLLVIGMFFGGILFLHVVFEIIRYLILKNRFYKI